MMKRMRRYAKVGVTAACVAFFAACENTEDPIAPPQQELTSAEAESINETIVGLAFQGWGFDQAAGSRVPAPGGGLAASMAPINIDWALNVETACDEGGTFGVSGAITGSIDDQTFAGNLTLGVTTSMTACAVIAEEQTITLTTNPDFQLDGTVAWDQNGLVGTSTFTYVGGLDWSASDGRSGSCDFNVTVTLAQDGSETAAGQVCGVSVDSASL